MATIDIPVLRSKITPDVPPRGAVARPRLERILDGPAQVVAVSAPAGYGKSALVAGWVAAHPETAVAWVSVDAQDRPTGFWRHVIAAIAQHLPSAEEAGRILGERGLEGRDFLAALVHELLEADKPVVVVIDDIHAVDGGAVREDLTLLVERCPGVLRLVVCGRTDAPLPMARWRAEGRAVEVRADDLAFGVDEADALLSRFRVSELGREGVSRLTERTEGWAVGLLLSAMALERHPSLEQGLDAVVHSDRHLADYLVEEVLERLPAETREVALLLAVPPFFDLPLATVVTGRADAGALVREILQRNPFVVESATATYRFHPLIRTLLLTELEWRHPERLRATRRLAAGVMVERGQVGAAVELLLAASAVDEACDVVVLPVLALSDAGHIPQFRGWFAQLPPMRPTDPERALQLSFALSVAGRFGEAIDWAERAARMGDLQDVRFRMLQAVVCLVARVAGGHLDGVRPLLAELDTIGHDVTGSALIDSRVSLQVVRASLGLAELDLAERWLPAVESNESPIVSAAAGRAMRAWHLLQRGDARGSGRLAAEAVAAARSLAPSTHPIAVDARLVLAAAMQARMDLGGAARVIDEVNEDTDLVSWPFFRVRVWALLVGQRALQQGWPAALELVQGMSPQSGDGPSVSARRTQLLARALLGCGRVEEALASIEDLEPGRRRSLLLARAAVVGDRTGEVPSLLEGYESWTVPHRLEAALLLAQTEEDATADDALTEALRLGNEGGWLAPFVLEGRSLDRRLQRLPVAELHPELNALGRADPSDRRVAAGRALEPLTGKESEVLAHLPSHLTYSAIGAQLYVSVNTVKTYVNAIFRKLGVSSRSEAVEVARTAGLLPPPR